MKQLLISLAALILLGIPSLASADTITFQPSPSNLDNLDHYSAYSWNLGNVDLHGQTITGATLTFKDMRNWNTSSNILFIHLFDSAVHNGVASFNDATPGSPDTIRSDVFDPNHFGASALFSPAAQNLFLTSQSFTDQAKTWTYTFTADQLRVLSSYFASGHSAAFGFDPDCHYFNNGVTFTMMTTGAQPTPEPTTMALLGTGLAGLYYRRRRQKQQRTASES